MIIAGLLALVAPQFSVAEEHATQAGNQRPTVVKHYDHGFSPQVRLYLRDVLTLILDKSAARHGPYQLNLFSDFLSPNRSKIETERGALLNVLFSSHWEGPFTDVNKIIEIEFPIFEGMLGLRALVVRSDNQQAFQSIANRQDFLPKTAGMGANWIDASVLRHNRIPVTESQSLNALFLMLTHRRYDYLPLSVLEAQSALRKSEPESGHLTLLPDPHIFYAFPFYLYVNAKQPELAERLAQGLGEALQDGSISELFAQHFQQTQTEFSSGAKHIIALENPMLTPQQNQDHLQKFLQQYPNAKLLQ